MAYSVVVEVASKVDEAVLDCSRCHSAHSEETSVVIQVVKVNSGACSSSVVAVQGFGWQSRFQPLTLC